MPRRRMSDELKTSMMVRRIKRAWRFACPDQERRGREWYSEARSLADEIAGSAKITPAAAAAIIAALSPMVSWEENARNARDLAEDPEGATVSSFRRNREKAVAILGGEDPDEILGGKKVRAFWKCIHDPSDPEAVCVDRHAGRVALGWKMKHEEIMKWLDRAGVNEKIQEAYRLAADHLGELPQTVQAVTWLVCRERS